MPSGSLRKATINGVTYNVAQDANASKMPRIKKEGVPHSGGVDIKVTFETGAVEGLTLLLNDTEYERLNNGLSSFTDIPMSYEKADGSVWSCKGQYSLDNYESEENKCDITMIPTNGRWQLFSA